MRKSLIAKQVKYFYDLMNLEITKSAAIGGNYVTIKNWNQISKVLYEIDEYSFIGNSVQDIFNLDDKFESSKEVYLSEADYNRFLIKFNLLKAKCEAIISLYSFDDDINDIYIKLPEGEIDLLDLSKITKDLDLVFNKCPLLSKEIGKISFKKVEEGSNWLVISIGCLILGSKALDWIAKFVKNCNDIRLQNRTIKGIELDNILKEMQIEDKIQEQKYKKNVEKIENEKLKGLCLKKFKEIGINCDNMTPEDESRIVHCMKILIDLLDKGVEIYPSVETKEETKKLFPKQEDFKLIEDSKKLLEEPEENKK